MTLMTGHLARKTLLTLWVSLLPIGGIAADDSVPFIVNKGQCDPAVLFYARSFGGTVFVENTGEIRYLLHGSDKTNDDDLTVTEKLMGETKPVLHGQGQAVTKVGFFKDRELTRWTSYVPTFDLINVDSAYSGVSIVLSAYEDTFEKRFEINPGQESPDLEFQVEPSDRLTLGESGDLTLDTDAGRVQFGKPVAFQINGDRMNYLDIAYVLSGGHYRFALGRHDPSLPTTIITRTLVLEPGEYSR